MSKDRLFSAQYRAMHSIKGVTFEKVANVVELNKSMIENDVSIGYKIEILNSVNKLENEVLTWSRSDAELQEQVVSSLKSAILKDGISNGFQIDASDILVGVINHDFKDEFVPARPPRQQGTSILNTEFVNNRDSAMFDHVIYFQTQHNDANKAGIPVFLWLNQEYESMVIFEENNTLADIDGVELNSAMAPFLKKLYKEVVDKFSLNDCLNFVIEGYVISDHDSDQISICFTGADTPQNPALPLSIGNYQYIMDIIKGMVNSAADDKFHLCSDNTQIYLEFPTVMLKSQYDEFAFQVMQDIRDVRKKGFTEYLVAGLTKLAGYPFRFCSVKFEF